MRNLSKSSQRVSISGDFGEDIRAERELQKAVFVYRIHRAAWRAIRALWVPGVIFGLLFGIAWPNYQKFGCRARSSEAKSRLKALYVGQEDYRAEMGVYKKSFLEIDRRNRKGSRYDLFLISEPSSFRAFAIGVPGKGMAGDVWTINDQNELHRLQSACD